MNVRARVVYADPDNAIRKPYLDGKVFKELRSQPFSDNQYDVKVYQIYEGDHFTLDLDVRRDDPETLLLGDNRVWTFCLQESGQYVSCGKISPHPHNKTDLVLEADNVFHRSLNGESKILVSAKHTRVHFRLDRVDSPACVCNLVYLRIGYTDSYNKEISTALLVELVSREAWEEKHGKRG